MGAPGGESASERDKGLDRIVTLSDAVFAFAITLLALDLALPTLPENAPPTQLAQSLLQELPALFDYIVSFFIVSWYWILHHRNFRHIRRYDGRLMWLNMLFLLFITLIPFLTRLWDAYGDVQLIVVIYASGQASAGLLMTLLWLYASAGHRFIDDGLSPRMIRWFTIRNIVPPVTFLASIGFSFIDLGLTALFWMSMFPILGAIGRRYNIKD